MIQEEALGHCEQVAPPTRTKQTHPNGYVKKKSTTSFVLIKAVLVRLLCLCWRRNLLAMT
jgi:hypothetical protein